MGNWKALFVLVFSTLLLGFCLVPAFAEDAAVSNQNGNSTITVEQTNVPGDGTGANLASDDEPDSKASDTADAVAPEKLKSVYDLASEHVDDLADGLYTLGSSVNGKFVLDIPGGTAGAGKKLQLFGTNNTDAQIWRVSHDQNGFVVLASVKGCTLDVSGGSASDGNPIQLWSDIGTLAQRWIAIKETDGSYMLVSALDQTFAIDVAGGAASNGSAVQLYKVNGTAAQRWVLTPAKTEQQHLDDRAAAHRYDLADGTYAILASNDSLALKASGGSLSFDKFGYSGIQMFDVLTTEDGYRTIAINGTSTVLDAAGGNDANGTKLQSYSANGSKDQKWIIEKDGERLRIVSALNGRKVADIPGGSISSGAGLQLYDANGTAAQSFYFVDLKAVRSELDKLASDNRDVVKDGEYAIIAGPSSSRMVLDVVGGSTSSGANVQIYQSNATDAQRWRVSHDDDGYLTITNIKSGKVLDASAGSTSLGTNVQQYSACGDANYAQKWIAALNGDGSVRLLSAVWQQRSLDVAGGSLKSQSNIRLYVSNGTAAQRFYFIAAKPEPVDPCEDILKDVGWCVISPSSNSAAALDVVGGSLKNGGNVQTHSRNGTLSQLFKAEYCDGYYVLCNAGSGKVLDVTAGDVVPGTNIQQWNESPNDNQLFSVVRNEDGSYTFINKGTGLTLAVSGSNVVAATPGDSVQTSFALIEQEYLLNEGLYEIYSSTNSSYVLDVAGGSAGTGANVQLYASNGSFAQKWLLKKVDGAKNTYTLESVCSSNKLAVSGSNVCTAASTDAKAQQWTVRIDKTGIEFVSVDKNLSLDVKGGNFASSSNVQVYTSNDSAAQRFRLRSTSADVANGTYFIRMASRANSVLDVSGGSSADGANVQIWQNNDTGAQKWNFSRNVDGSYTIVNAASGKALDVKDAAVSSGTNIQQWSRNGSAAQRWYIEYASGGFILSSALNTAFVIDVSGGNAANGTNVVLYASNDSKAQRFTFKATTYVQPLPADQQAMYNRAQWYNSNTEWLILTDTVGCRTGIFRGSRGNWKLWSFWQCAPGKNGSPTVLGEYSVYGKGLSFGHGYTCWYYTQFYGDYLFHTQPCYTGTFNVKDPTMGQRASAGCIRLTTDHAKWIYDNIPYGTKVVNY
ncbi:RICIN domain-containing protein [Collinsella sp. SGI.184]|uniref:RICIN domain-containing protein n=1 Tax=Collinsella sp. SGI.184 TaxID=3420556 RepID=UPI003CFBDA21